MKQTLSLIKKFVDVDISSTEIANILTLSGMEVESIENETPSFEGVVSAEIKEVEKHPSADRLSIAKVYDGEKDYSIVCGASNCRKGIKVALAKIGAQLTDENNKKWKIKRSKLRGIESEGMLCASEELCLSEKSEGILELEDDIEIGKDLSFLSDPIFDISLTPNLGHCLSSLGIARELAALLDKEIHMPSFQLKESDKPANKEIDISLNTEKCQRYACRIIEGIKIIESPFWLKKDLESCGYRPINAVVDSINYAMLLFGQPMHAFDYDKISGKTISIQKTKKNISLLTLDGEIREVPIDSLIISDKESPIAIAGIMGGQSSAISDGTTKILIESAYFDPITIRRTSKNLNLRSESSIRFEKGTDPNIVIYALDFATHLINSICGGTILNGAVDAKLENFPPKKISIRLKKLNSIIGKEFSLNEVESIFKRLGFSSKEQELQSLLVTVPYYRHDIEQEIDLIEEIIRIYGYNNIEKKQSFFKFSDMPFAPLYELESKLRNYALQEGMQEFVTCDLISPEMISTLSKEYKKDVIEVIHAKSKEQSMLRPTLLCNFLEVIKFNNDHRNFNISAFEIGRVHFKDNDKFLEQPVISFVMSGKNHSLHWQDKPKNIDFFDLKGSIENIFSQLKIKKVEFNNSQYEDFHPYIQANISVDNANVGVIAEVHPQLLSKYDIKEKVYFAEISTSFLIEKMKDKIKINEICPYPSSERDLTITIPKDLKSNEILKFIHNFKSKLLEKVKIIDLYKDESADTQNLTLRFTYTDTSKTISFEQAEKEHERITKEIKDFLKNTNTSS